MALGSDDILVGTVNSLSAGAVIGPITDNSKVGTSVYKLTASFSAKINGQSIIAAATYSENFNIHVVSFTLSPPSTILYAIGKIAITHNYSVNYSPVHPEVPIFTYPS